MFVLVCICSYLDQIPKEPISTLISQLNKQVKATQGKVQMHIYYALFILNVPRTEVCSRSKNSTDWLLPVTLFF